MAATVARQFMPAPPPPPPPLPGLSAKAAGAPPSGTSSAGTAVGAAAGLGPRPEFRFVRDRARAPFPRPCLHALGVEFRFVRDRCPGRGRGRDTTAACPPACWLTAFRFVRERGAGGGRAHAAAGGAAAAAAGARREQRWRPWSFLVLWPGPTIPAAEFRLARERRPGRGGARPQEARGAATRTCRAEGRRLLPLLSLPLVLQQV